MTKFTILASILLILLGMDMQANPKSEEYQRRRSVYKKIIMQDSLTIKDHVYDTLLVYKRGANGLIDVPPKEWTPFDDSVSFRDTMIYDPAYLPVVFDGKILPSNLNLYPQNRAPQFLDNLSLIPKDSTFAPLLSKANNVHKQRQEYYTNINNIGNIHYNLFALREIPKLDNESAVKHNILKDLITVEDSVTIEPITLPQVTPRYIYWTYNGEHSLQVSQNSMSKNWYQGGSSSFYIVSNQKFYLNYKKDKISFNNSLEWRLNIASMPADSLHKYSISEDFIKMINTLGIKAFDKWEYTGKLESQTQAFKSYPINSNDVRTSFLSPLIVNFALGMQYSNTKTYESDKKKKLAYALNLAPASVNYIYLKNNDITNRQGLDADKNSKLEIGSMVNFDLSFAFNRYTSWTSRLKYFTNYDRSQVEFENKFNMQLNRFFSVAGSVYLRFDDSGTYENGWGYFQMNQLMSFGINYKW